MNQDIKNAAYFGIAYFILIIPQIIAMILYELEILNKSHFVLYASLMVIPAVLYIFFMYGFVLIGKKLKNNKLVVSSYILMAVAAISALTEAFSFHIPYLASIAIDIVLSLVIGVTGIIFGIALLKLQKKFKGLAKACGILNIIVGALLLSILLAIVSLLLLIPLAICEIMLLLRAAKKLK